ncbi:TorF family putative porin [Pseudomonas sp. S 311-6]|jgi:uncharacterized protein (TIGR02001 family)|uniref:Uncharacterized protein (TIGR02001 family) n=1 Tax=Kerstersia gyiorum TaxID=206506 RepID=A0A4Q7MH89_9BURK|nr:TorF family putative porin [Kerstersia gyiorum]AZV93840.1 hypothetical protein CBF45_08965 [Bordetella sp. J329]MCO7639572.1 TorF family putative porin [Pseudomonas sp. S 311-6]KAB0543046.1 hypothetical protein F7P85_10805 [Kerstersia gyiorum]MCH4272413.1 TorF family putative porin [Kerstersia gyiorum]MCI1229470.1 TorF family putative porin [Kerstersia gyiorum]
MKNTLLVASLATAALGLALGAPPARAETDLGAGFTLSGNATLTNDYRFRGYSQTNFRPAAQLGVDLTHTSGFYLGNWNSNVADNVFNEANLEMDFYGGWSGELGHGLGLDIGVLQYWYPGSDKTPVAGKGGNFSNTDLYLGLSYEAFSLKYSYSPSDFFNTPDSKGTWYLDASASFDLGDGWGLDAHLGYQKLKNQVDMNGDGIGHYVDYRLGVSKDLNGWVLGLAAVGASDSNWLPTRSGKESGRLGAVFSVSRAF